MNQEQPPLPSTTFKASPSSLWDPPAWRMILRWCGKGNDGVPMGYAGKSASMSASFEASMCGNSFMDTSFNRKPATLDFKPPGHCGEMGQHFSSAGGLSMGSSKFLNHLRRSGMISSHSTMTAAAVAAAHPSFKATIDPRKAMGNARPPTRTSNGGRPFQSKLESISGMGAHRPHLQEHASHFHQQRPPL